MKRVYECLLVCFSEEQVEQLIKEGEQAHILFTPYCIEASQVENEEIIHILIRHVIRYDAMVIAMDSMSLAQARILLNLFSHLIDQPIIAWGLDVQLVALQDMLYFGVDDFVLGEKALSELYVRIFSHHRQKSVSLNPQSTHTSLCLSENKGEGYQVMVPIDTDLSFSEFKQQVLNHYEKAYISAQLKRFEGNVSLAAKASKKHRRAFWEVMRKRGLKGDDFKPY